MDDLERDLREMLNDRVATAPAPADASPELLARARRRRATRMTALAVSVVIVAGGTAGAIVQVAGRHGPQRVVTTPIYPSVPTAECTVNLPENVDGSFPPPDTSPRVPRAGDPDQVAKLESYAANPEPRYVVLGPTSWSCRATPWLIDGSMVIYDRAATHGAVPGPDEAPIAVHNNWLRSPDFGAQLACSVFDAAALRHLVRTHDAGDCDGRPQDRTVTQVSAHVVTFVEGNGDRGLGWMLLPSSDRANDGRISVLSCRPSTGQISAAACGTIIADYAARLEAARTTVPRPSVPTVACPASTEAGNGQPSIAIAAPTTTPRVPAGDAEQLATLQSFAMIDDPRYVVLGPDSWSCHARVTDGANSMVVYDPDAHPGQVASVDAAPIALENDALWNEPMGALLACSVFDDPAVVEFTRRDYAENCLSSRSPRRTVTRVSEHMATFVDANGDRGAAWMQLPSSNTANDGKISVLTCRPAGELTVAACDTIIADFFGRVVSALTPLP